MMRRITIILVLIGLVLSLGVLSFSKDWDIDCNPFYNGTDVRFYDLWPGASDTWPPPVGFIKWSNHNYIGPM
jgi:hypothetical protein